jgi:ribosomal protein S18 acetylase RimI-like enzyme
VPASTILRSAWLRTYGNGKPSQLSAVFAEGDPDGLWIAEDGGEILGFAWSWVCGELWFLAQLFVNPTQQGRGIGNELLKLTLHHARQSKAAHKALITFTFNRVSQGLYIRHGLFPRMPIYFPGARREQVTERLPKPPLESVAIGDTPSSIEKLFKIDSRAIAVSREKHHRYLLNYPASTGVLL